MDDRSIVALYLRRDETAVRQTAEKYGSRLRALAYGIVNALESGMNGFLSKPIVIDDLVQELHKIL